MKEELTTKMHGEFLDKEITNEELNVMGAYGAISRGVPVTEALKKYGLSVEEYEKLKSKYLL